MATAAGVRAGRAFVTIEAVDLTARVLGQVSKRMMVMGRMVTRLGRQMLTLGAVLAAPIALAVRGFANAGRAINDMSLRTGIGAEALQELGYAAKLTGADAETLETGLRRMQKVIDAAAKGSKSAQKVLGDLVDLDALGRMSPEEQLLAIGDAISRIVDPTERAAAATAIFGRSGTRLIPMFAEGAAKLAAMRKEARDLGLVMSAQDVRAADDLGDSFDTLWFMVKAASNAVGAALAPVLMEIIPHLKKALSGTIAWARANARLIVIVAGLVAGIFVAGFALVVLGSLISTLGAIVGVVSVLLSVKTAILFAYALVCKLAAFATALLTGAVALLQGVLFGLPFAVLAIGLVALVAGVIYFRKEIMGMISGALEPLGQAFKKLLAIAQMTFGGLANAIKAGDMQLAMTVLWAGLQAAWTAGSAGVMGAWANFRDSLLNGWTHLKTAIAKIVVDLWSFIQKAFITGSAMIGQALLAYNIAWLQLVQAIIGVDMSTKILGLSAAAVEVDLLGKAQKADVDKAAKGQKKALDDMSAQEIAKRAREREKNAGEWTDATIAAENALELANIEAAQAAARVAAGVAKTPDLLPEIPDLANEPTFKKSSALDALEKGSVEAAKAAIEGKNSFATLLLENKKQTDLLGDIKDNTAEPPVDVDEVG